MLDLRDWLIQRQPLWLRNALNLTTSEVPRGLLLDRDKSGIDSPPIAMTLDAYQGGLGVATVEQDTTVSRFLDVLDPLLVLGADASSFQLNADVVNTSGLMLAMSVTSIALAATRHFNLEISNNVLTMPLAANIAIPTVSKMSWKDIAGTADARIYIPPGYFVLVRALDLAAAETLEVFTTIIRIPQGFKPF